jgi:hypothetical protein
VLNRRRARSSKLLRQIDMTYKRRPHRLRAAGRADASWPESGVEGPADCADAPDSLGAARLTQAVSPTARDPAANDIEHVDELQPTSIEAVSGPADGGGIPGFAEPTVAEGEAAESNPGP